MGETISNIKYLTLSRMLELGFAFFLNVILFRLLSPDGMGTYALIVSFVAIAQTLSDVGIGEATMYYLAKSGQNHRQARKVFGTGFLSLTMFSVIFALGLSVLSPFFAELYSIRAAYFILAGIMLCSVVVKVSADQALEARKHFKARSLVGIIFTLSRFSSVALIVLGFGAFGAVSGEIVGQIVSVALALLVLRKLISAHFSWDIFRKLFSYARRIVIGTFFNLVQAHGVILILGYFTLSGNGVFSALAKFGILVSALSNSMLKVLYPRIVELRRRREELRSQFSIFFKYNLIIPIFLGGMSIIFAKPFLHFVYGEKIVGAELTFAIIMIAAIIDAVSILFFKLLTAMERPELLSKSIAAKALIILMLSVLLIPRYEALGAAVSVLGGMVIGNILLLVFSKGLLDFPLPIGLALKCLAALTIIAVISTPIIPRVSEAGGLVFGALIAPVYFLILFAFGAITKKDVNYVKAFILG